MEMVLEIPEGGSLRAASEVLEEHRFGAQVLE